MNPTVDLLRATFGTAIGRASVAHDGETVVFVHAERLRDVMQWLRDSARYDYLVDITAIEYRDGERPIEVVYFLRALERRADLRVKVELDPAEALAVDSVVPLWNGANWLEREVYDMFGVQYEGHPDLKRILMPDGWTGYPLRKDYDILRQDEAWVQANLNIKSAQ